MCHLRGLSQSTERIIVGHTVRQGLDRALEVRPGVGGVIGGQAGVELSQSSGVTQLHHRWGDLLQTVPLADQPGEERHAAAGAVGVLIGVVGLADEVWFAILRPLRCRCEIGKRIVADHGCAPPRESFAGAYAAQVAIHRALTEFGFKQGGDAVRVAEGSTDLDGGSRCVIAAHVVGAAGAVGSATQGENNDADGASGSAEDYVVGGHHAIGIVDQILSVLQRRLAERGVNKYGYPAARTGSHKLRVALETRPCWRDRAIAVDGDWFVPFGSCLDAVIHRKNLHFGQTMVRNRSGALQPLFRPEVGSVISQQGWNAKPADLTDAKTVQSVTKTEFLVRLWQSRSR